MKNLPDAINNINKSKHNKDHDNNDNNDDDDNDDDDNNNNIYNEKKNTESDEETDEEIMNIIQNHITHKINDDLYFISDEIPKKKEENKQKKKVKTLDDYIKEDESTKPKKWASDRAENKKKVIDIEKIYKRNFRPRLPPFRTIERKKYSISMFDDSIINNEESFPSL